MKTIHNEISDILSLKTVEFEYKCKYKTETHPDGCADTESGYLMPLDDGPLVRCQCFWDRVKDKRLKHFYSILPKKYDLSKHEIREGQLTVIDLLLPEKVNGNYKRLKQGAWLFGRSGFGKTHLIYFILLKIIENTDGNPYTYKIIKAKGLLDLWVDQYGDDRIEAKRRINEVFNSDIIVIEEMDKIGQVTQARDSELFDMLNELSEKQKILYITSQISIHDYCSMFGSEIRYRNNENNQGPRENRLRDLCKEIKV